MKSRSFRRGLAALALVGAACPVVAPGARAATTDRYVSQRIDWKPCFAGRAVPDGLPDGSGALECGSYLVPQDWDDPAAGTDLTIAVSRLAPPGGATSSLLTNPGGPGGPGRSLPLLFLEEGRAKVLSTFEVIGIDVRGTGDSTNVSCNRQADTASELDPRDRSAENVETILDAAAYVARACQGAAGELGRYITTAQTVRDLDLLRALLGREKISWVGYSGGTWLGAYYATAFPKHVDRFVLDSNAEFTAPWQKSFGWQPLGFQRRFDADFLPWVAKYNETFGLGSTAAAVRAVYEATRARLAAQPLLIDDETTVYPATLDNLMAQSLYSGDSFQSAAEALRYLRDATASGGGQQLRPNSTTSTTGSSTSSGAFRFEPAPAGLAEWARRANSSGSRLAGPPVAPDADSATFLSITCNDTAWTGGRPGLKASSAREGKAHPLIGWSTLHQPCMFWSRPPLQTPLPDGAGVPPVLMIQTVHDPATPLEGAQAAHRAFAGSRLLTVTGEGNHGVYAIRRNACVDKLVEAFLLGGAAPADTTCAGAAPFPPVANDSPFTDVLDRATVAGRAALWARLAGPLPR